MNVKIFAAVDIGSNAIRLMISDVIEYHDRAEFNKVAFLRVPIRLGEDVFTNGVIGEEKIERMIEAMSGFVHLMKAYDVMSYRAYATSAMREAANGPAVIERIGAEAGLKVEIISGSLEAETVFASGISDAINPDKNYLYVDVGGGSTEIVVYVKHEKITSRSFPLGTVRALAGKIDEEQEKKLKKWLKEISSEHEFSAIIGSGGNINKVQKMLNKKEKESVKYTELKVLHDYLKTFDFEERVQLLKLNTYRADVIIPAMKIFMTIAKTCKIDEIIVPKTGLVDGIIRLLYKESLQK